MVVEAASLLIGGAGLAWGVYSHLDARRERRRREAADDARGEEERARLEAERESETASRRPRLAVGFTNRPPQSRADRAARVDLRVENKGPTLAQDVTFGLRWRAQNFSARLSGDSGPRPIDLAVGEARDGSVQLPGEASGEEQTTPLPWVRYRDQWGAVHSEP
jgi:hypothetical protein